ncbi:MAG: hypothetical protein H8D67_05895 [Deltaproteobacteria bacterium]|nr:hypothetical protein [Deltaproteobacteria bacterium]
MLEIRQTSRVIDEGAIYCQQNSNPIILNNIVANNINGYGIAADDTSLPQLSYNGTWNNQKDYHNVGFPGEGFIQANPLFVDEANHDYHLQPGSPCINAGNPDPQYDDPDGSPNDMGAYGGPYAKIETPPIKDGDVSLGGYVLAYPRRFIVARVAILRWSHAACVLQHAPGMAPRL